MTVNGLFDNTYDATDHGQARHPSACMNNGHPANDATDGVPFYPANLEHSQTSPPTATYNAQSNLPANRDSSCCHQPQSKVPCVPFFPRANRNTQTNNAASFHPPALMNNHAKATADMALFSPANTTANQATAPPVQLAAARMDSQANSTLANNMTDVQPSDDTKQAPRSLTGPPFVIQDCQAVIGDKHVNTQGRKQTTGTTILKELILPFYKANLPNYPSTPAGRDQCRQLALRVHDTVLSEKFPNADERQRQPRILIHCTKAVMEKGRAQVGEANTFKYNGETSPRYGPVSDAGIIEFFKTRVPRDQRSNTIRDYQRKVGEMRHCPALEHFREELSDCKKMVFLQQEAIDCPEFHDARIKSKLTLLNNLWQKENFRFNDLDWTLEKWWSETSQGNPGCDGGALELLKTDCVAVPRSAAAAAAAAPQQPTACLRPATASCMNTSPRASADLDQRETHSNEPMLDDAQSSAKKKRVFKDDSCGQPESMPSMSSVPNETTRVDNKLREIREAGEEDIIKLGSIDNLEAFKLAVQTGIVTPRLTRLTSALIKAGSSEKGKQSKQAATKTKIIALIAKGDLQNASLLYNLKKNELSDASKKEIGLHAHEVYDEGVVSTIFEGGLPRPNQFAKLDLVANSTVWIEQWSEQWAKSLIPKDERSESEQLTFDAAEYLEANQLDSDRKVCVEYLKILHRNFEHMGSQEVAKRFPGRHLVDILSCTLEMDRAKARYFITLDTLREGKRRGQHWFAEKHLDPESSWCRPEWQEYVRSYEGKPTISKRLMWLFDEEVFGLRTHTKLHKLLEPQKACWARNDAA